MFGLFKKKDRGNSDLEALKNSDLKNMYFIRLSQWDWLNEKQITVMDNNSPRMITLEPWTQIVFLEANGQRTVQEFIKYMASQYGKDESVPQELESNIIGNILDLVKEKLIEVIPQSKNLPYYLDLPNSQQDLDKASALMKEDGFR